MRSRRHVQVEQNVTSERRLSARTRSQTENTNGDANGVMCKKKERWSEGRRRTSILYTFSHVASTRYFVSCDEGSILYLRKYQPPVWIVCEACDALR
jgi:hypothetical protein